MHQLLKPCVPRNESVAFDTTQNLFIEGDNLEALKLLQESYLGKVKMIYMIHLITLAMTSFMMILPKAPMRF